MSKSESIFESSQKTPLVSVVMAVKNGGDYIRQSLNSVIHQTFSDIEIIIIDDGSEDDTLKIIQDLNDSRIQIYSQKNRGVARSANRGLALARGKYIARIDHDDVWFPERLEKQITFLRDYPEVALVGSAAVIWSGSGYSGRNLDHPTSPAQIKWELLFNNPFVHSSILFRKEIIKKVGLYYPGPDVTPLDDYQFISRVASMYQIANLAERLVAYRETPQSLTSNFRGSSEEKAHLFKLKLAKISTENISRLNQLLSADQVCVNFGRAVHQAPFKANFLDFHALEGLLKKSIEKISASYPSLMIDQNKLLNDKLEDLRFKWFVDTGPGGVFDLALFSIRDAYLNFKGSPSKEFKKYYSVIAQYFSTKYWMVREFIYHKLHIKEMIASAKKYRSGIKK